MLAGLTPEVILDVTTRGLAFYDFQLHLELVGACKTESAVEPGRRTSSG